MTEKEIRYLILNEGENKSNELYRLRKGSIIQMKINPLFSWKKIRVFTNLPLQENEEFNRLKYNELKWIYQSSSKYDDSDRYVQFQCFLPGTFHFYFTIDGSSEKQNLNGQGYFQIEAELIYFGRKFEQESICCQSVLSKSLGEIDQWLSRLQVAFHSGYNFIHFTPIQLLYHVSNSSYAITDHHQLNPLFGQSFERIKEIIDYMAQQWNILSITDLVYNHAANDCALLREHPEAAYNLVNSPHLKPAALLDSILMQFTRDASEEKLLSKGIPSEIKEHHLSIIKNYLLNEQIPQYRLYEYYICDTDKIIEEFREKLNLLEECPKSPLINDDYHLQIKHANYQRMKSFIDLDLAEKIYYFKRDHCQNKEDFINAACHSLKDRIHLLNHLKCQRLNENLNRAIDNCLASCRYHFFSSNGPKFPRLSLPSTPFVGNYFHYPDDQFKHPDEINQLIENDFHYQSYVMAHNGWVMNDDPLRSFADEGQDIYLRRDLLQWSDIIKLRFGNKREDSPALYDYMKEYTRLIATTFHGCRLDNCHSTPLWLAQEMMDYARFINPNFYINAELFTGNLQTDIQFINQIGINSLVRESYRAFDPYELGQIGSSVSEANPIGSFFQENRCELKSVKPYSWFYDQTHDNPCQITARSVEDILPRSAIVSFCSCSNGSNRGYDELVPHHIDVVHETRFYSIWDQQTNSNTGIISLKKSLNQLHVFLAQNGFSQLMVDQLSSSVIVMTRHNPINRNSIVLISHTSFCRPSSKWEYIRPLEIDGLIEKIIVEGSLKHPYENESIETFQRSNIFINGLEQTNVYFRQNILFNESKLIRLITSNANDSSGIRLIEFTEDFHPGSIIVLQISPLNHVKESLIKLNHIVEDLSNIEGEFYEIIKELTLVDLERILYRSSNEEQSDGKGFDVYDIPNYGSVVYCGLHSFVYLLNEIYKENNINHPLMNNLKQGNWLMDYISSRLIIYGNTKRIGLWYENVFREMKKLARVMIGSYFYKIMKKSYEILIEYSYSLMSSFVRQSSSFVHQLSQSSIQLMSIVSNARLPLLSPTLREPRPTEQIDEHTFEKIQLSPSLAAGFPHFASGIWRNWGRDTFISLRGLLLLTGRYDEARYLILSYGECLRHGLIPNLLGDGKIARYNARDAVWWWLNAISNYTTMVPDGHLILSDRVSRLYPTHDSPMQPVGLHDQCLYDVIHEVFLRHVQLLSFRERGAGHSLDSDMNDEGFNNQIGIDMRTGFVYGGNRWNCGTWMDKMGSSDKAGNKGHPATPRDGSPIELIGLSRSVIQWIILMNQQGFYPYDSVETSSGSSGKSKLFFTDWLNKIDEHFEKEFWIDETNSSEYVNRRMIYKDTINSSLKWTDFQFRPNFLIAAVIAPEMFHSSHIWKALQQLDSILLGKYGIKTLDPSDYNYVGDYVNDDDSHDYKRARGFNYHNGPEWLWLTGFYIRAKIYWAKQQNDPLIIKQTIKHCKKYLSSHIDLLRSNMWNGLPELTNQNGNLCSYSCSVQAWSAATLIEAFYDLFRS